MTLFGDTIAAIATAPGRGGVAVVRVSGSEAFAVAERLAGRRPEPGRMLYTAFRDRDGALVDRGLLLAFANPHSYTGEDVVELQGHGGSVTPRRLLDAAVAAGARLARRGEFTERAFLNGKLDYAQAESVLELVDAKTVRAADAALAGLSGRRQRDLRDRYDEALAISAELEHALDVDENELPAEFMAAVVSRVEALKAALRKSLCRLRESRMLREGVLVVLSGPPNVGKSSLMNALLERNRAIVSDVPGTTRDSIEEWMDLNGWPIRLTDTAGLRETEDTVEREGVRRSRALADEAELVLKLSTAGNSTAVEGAAAENASSRTIEVCAKCDLRRGKGLNVSAITGEGVDDLKREIVARLEALAANGETSASGGERAAEAVASAIAELENFDAGEPVLAANAVRSAAQRLGGFLGATYTSDLLDSLFSRFCVGK